MKFLLLYQLEHNNTDDSKTDKERETGIEIDLF